MEFLIDFLKISSANKVVEARLYFRNSSRARPVSGLFAPTALIAAAAAASVAAIVAAAADAVVVVSKVLTSPYDLWPSGAGSRPIVF